MITLQNPYDIVEHVLGISIVRPVIRCRMEFALAVIDRLSADRLQRLNEMVEWEWVDEGPEHYAMIEIDNRQMTVRLSEGGGFECLPM